MKKYLPYALILFIMFVFLQSLPFKFTNSLETQHIFTTLAEWSGIHWFGQYGGYMIGIFELIAAILLITKLHVLGAILALGIMSGAIFFHLFTPLGIVMPYFDPKSCTLIGSDCIQNGNDGGVLFIMACITWVCALLLIWLDYQKEHSLLKKIRSKSV